MSCNTHWLSESVGKDNMSLQVSTARAQLSCDSANAKREDYSILITGGFRRPVCSSGGARILLVSPKSHFLVKLAELIVNFKYIYSHLKKSLSQFSKIINPK